MFATLTDPKRSAPLFIVVLAIMYGLIPFVAYTQFFESPYFYELSIICVVSCVALAAGFVLPLCDGRFKPGATRFVIHERGFHAFVWISFGLFMVTTLATAQSIPLLSALAGAAADDLSNERGAFLKGRVGAELALLYISTVFLTTLLPYSLVHLFIKKSRWRFMLAAVFFLFSISFMQKTLFLNLIFPLIYFAVQRLRISGKKIFLWVAVCLAFLYFVTALSKAEVDPSEGGDSQSFLAAGYLPASPLQMLLWRSVAVPVFTASDTLLVFQEQFDAVPLLGATSSMISGVFAMENVNMERLVFAHQFGGWNDIANANAVFMVDAYVNFGWIGVVLFSMFVGQSLRWFRLSQDHAFKSLWLIYCFSLFSASLIGMMLSNGFTLLFFYALFGRLGGKARTVAKN